LHAIGVAAAIEGGKNEGRSFCDWSNETLIRSRAEQDRGGRGEGEADGSGAGGVAELYRGSGGDFGAADDGEVGDQLSG